MTLPGPHSRLIAASDIPGMLQEFRAGALVPLGVAEFGSLAIVAVDPTPAPRLLEVLAARGRGHHGDTLARWTVMRDPSDLARFGSLARLDVETSGGIGRAVFRVLFDIAETPLLDRDSCQAVIRHDRGSRVVGLSRGRPNTNHRH